MGELSQKDSLMPFQPRSVSDKEITKDVDRVLFDYSIQLMEYKLLLEGKRTTSATPKPKEGIPPPHTPKKVTRPP